MTVVWHYVIPMLLGRTYDMKSDKPGVDIFPQSEIDSATVIQRHFTDSQYRMVSDTQEARDFLDVSGELSLKIKTGMVNIEGLGNYMKETITRTDMVEILVKVHYETVTLTLPSTAQPRANWQLLDQTDIGTHFCRSMTYGGDMVASLRFVAKNSADREKIRAAVQANLQAGTGSFGLNVTGNFSQLQEDLKDSSTLEINYYATVPLKGVPNTIDSLMELVEDFPEQTQMVNNGTGVPLRMELFPLSALDSDAERYLETKAITDQLDLLETQLDDIRATKTSLIQWMATVPPVLEQKITDEIGEFYSKLEKISATFYEVIGNMDLAEGAKIQQFLPAFDAYDDGDGNLPDKYYRKFLLLRDKAIQSSPDLSLDVGGSTYTYWGKGTCSNAGVTSVYNGILVSTDNSRGGSAQFFCLTDNPKSDPSTNSFKRHPQFYSRFAPVLFQGRDDLKDQPMACAFCNVENRTSAVMLPSRTECPVGWTEEYKGYLMTTEFRSRKGDYICVDSNAESSSKQVLKKTASARSEHVIDVKISCGTLPCETYTKDSLVPCVVCTF